MMRSWPKWERQWSFRPKKVSASYSMLQMSDVTEERTAGRGEDSNRVNTFLMPEEPLPQSREQLSKIIATDIERTEPLQRDSVENATIEKSPTTNDFPKQQHNVEETRTKPRHAGQGRRRLYRRIRRTVINFFSHDLPLLRSPESIRAMPWKTRINFYLANPEESLIGWRLQQLIMFLLFINIGVMAAETVDGPRYGSSDPGYPYMPEDNFFNAVEAFFSFIYVVEFAVRWSTMPNQTYFWKSVPTWINFLAAIAALPRLAGLAINADTSLADTFMFNMRILRAARLIVLAQAYVGTKVLFRAVTAAIPPLTITLFFLLTVVMVFATAIFYAEPCYDLQTCTFTDILNTGYFVMLTVATVGYGNQVPSMHNAGSLLLVCIVMIFGTVYFSMPLAIVGIKYELAWTEYDEFARNAKLEQDNRPKLAKGSSSKLSIEASRRQLLAVETTNDETLERIEAHTMKYASSITCDRFYKLSQAILQVDLALQYIVSPTNAADTPKTLETVIQVTKRRSDEASQALDGIMTVIKLHSRVCAEAHELLSALKTQKNDDETDLDRFISSSKLASKEHHDSRAHNTTRMSRAKGAIASIGSKAVKAISRQDYHLNPKSLRATIWNTFEYRHDTHTARVVNNVRMCVIVLSIGVFYLQTTPELQKTGVQTFLCQRNVHDFCAKYDEPGCYVFKEASGSGSNISVEVTDQLLDFDCSIGDSDETCYASGVNFGSDNFPLSCTDVFPSRYGIEHICKNRLCNPPVQLIFDMEPYWIYIEFMFGIWFTFELGLRVYSHPVRRHLWGDLKMLGNVIFLIPFYVELVEIMIGEWPTYSVVPAMPSIFSVIRFLKCLRILKLGSHIPGSRVLIKTAQLTTERLAIPLFFLFLGCVVSAAVFFELERGTECFVGHTCLWWHKNVLTPEMSEGLPTGKRILVQNTLLTIITDMLHSTWFSLVSFTTVGYGDLHPRTSLGKLVDIVGMIFSSCYTAMPLTLVGGQFYICYEVHSQEKRLQRERARKRIKPDETGLAQSMIQAFPSAREPAEKVGTGVSSLPNVDSTRMNAQAKVDAVDGLRSIPLLSPRTMSISSSPSTVREEENTAAIQSYVHTTEVQIINNFFMMQKVFHETIKDISLLNQLGIERVNSMRKLSSEAATTLVGVRQREQSIEIKISENMEFCVTASLNFAGVIERIIETKRTRKKKASIIRTNALLAAAELSNELLQASTSPSAKSHKSNRSRRSITGIDNDGGSTQNLQAKGKSFKRVATLSKILAAQNVQSQNSRKNNWAEFTNKKNQR